MKVQEYMEKTQVERMKILDEMTHEEISDLDKQFKTYLSNLKHRRMLMTIYKIQHIKTERVYSFPFHTYTAAELGISELVSLDGLNASIEDFRVIMETL